MTIGAYTTAPALAWAGWRLRIPGGPIGGQYHGYIAPDDVVDKYGWPAGHSEIFRPMDNPHNLGIYPWHTWDAGWHGTPLEEGETVSDFVYRSPAEVRPRPNASGGVNVVRAVQQLRTPGYAVAPGNYKTLGSMGAANAPWTPMPVYACGGGLNDPCVPTGETIGPTGQIMQTKAPKICPAWGCGGPLRTVPIPWDGEAYVPPVSPAPAPVVAQPPPPTGPQPVHTVGTGCPVGQYQDAAGNCTSDWRNPYAMVLPLSSPISPAPTVPANTCATGYVMTTNGSCIAPGAPSGSVGTCPTGYTTDQYGNCVVSGVAPSGAGITDWLASSTSIFGMHIPNALLAGGVLLIAMKSMRR